MSIIFYNEWKGFLRNKLFLFFISFFVILLFIVTFFGIVQNNKQIKSQNDAHSHIRAQWDEMNPSNPHSAAHFGTYAFKPNSILNSLDEGVNAVTGLVLRLEGHKQNEVAFSEASQSLTVSKFGKFKVSLLFQFIIPLFLIFLAFNIYTSEISSGRLKLLLVQGNSLRKIVFAKVFSLLSLATILLLFTIIAQCLFNFSNIELDQVIRLNVFFWSYFIYYFIIISFTVLLSLILKKSTSALSLTIITWLLWTIFLPKTIGNFTESLTPLSTRIELTEKMKEDRSKGIDGHNPFDDRKKELEEEVLARYDVDSISDLPINFAGILMQADEEYGNKVWDKHYGDLYENLETQKRNYQFSGFINPFASLQSLSMASAGTDLFHHLDFLNAAELYRRYFIKTLNDEYAFGGSRTGERGWKASNEFFRSIKDFSYKEANFLSILSKYLIDIFCLLFWGMSLVVGINFFSRKELI
jgi:ABC-2 type transport system permease protein